MLAIVLRSGDLKEMYEMHGQGHSARAIPQELSQSRNRLLLNRKRVESPPRRGRSPKEHQRPSGPAQHTAGRCWPAVTPQYHSSNPVPSATPILNGFSPRMPPRIGTASIRKASPSLLRAAVDTPGAGPALDQPKMTQGRSRGLT